MKVLLTAAGAGALMAAGAIAVFAGVFLFTAFDLIDFLKSNAAEPGVPIFKGRREG